MGATFAVLAGAAFARFGATALDFFAAAVGMFSSLERPGEGPGAPQEGVSTIPALRRGRETVHPQQVHPAARNACAALVRTKEEIRKTTSPTPAAASLNQAIFASHRGMESLIVLCLFCQEQNGYITFPLPRYKG
jgi:hypothetical protein